MNRSRINDKCQTYVCIMGEIDVYYKYERQV